MAAQDRRPGHSDIVSLATDNVHFALSRLGLAFAFSGSVAQSIYGETIHQPEKIEVTMFSPVESIPELKQYIAEGHPAWFIYHPSTRRLRYIDSGEPGDIDIVIIQTIASITYIVTVNDFPVVPYSFILLRELMFWDNTPQSHTQSRKSRGSHILHMLSVLRRRTDLAHYPEFDQSLHAASVDRVAQFHAEHPNYRKEWQRMGLLQNRGHVSLREKDIRNEQKPRDVATSCQTQGVITLQSNILTIGPSVELNPTPDDLATSLGNMGLTDSPSVTPGASSSLAGDSTPPTSSTPKKKPKFSRMEIRRLAARKTVETLKQHGFACALFGSMACKLYGNNRIPNDIDVLVLPRQGQMLNAEEPTQESIKELLVSSAPDSFVLRPSQIPEATYKVLFFRPTPTSKPTQHHSTKVDILLPGVMHLPALPPASLWFRPNHIANADANDMSSTNPQVPVLPFWVLLLQKLQGWDDHRNAEETRYQEKAPVDVEDLDWMLSSGARKYVRNVISRRDWTLFDEEFEVLSKRRVEEFCVSYPRWKGIWTRLGFRVSN